MTAGSRRRTPHYMAKTDDPPPKPRPDPREARLAEALRANLRRRKASPPPKDETE